MNIDDIRHLLIVASTALLFIGIAGSLKFFDFGIERTDNFF